MAGTLVGMFQVRFLCFLAVCRLGHGATLQRLGSFSAKSPAFSTLYEEARPATPGDRYSLIVSTFSGPTLFSSSVDSVQLVRSVGAKLGNIGAITPEVVTKDVTWPNEISIVPDGVFNEKMLAIPDGFLVPFKTNGAVKLVDISTPGSSQGPYVLTDHSSGDWFYHRVEWHDMDGDGDQDIVTCRAREPVVPVIFGREDEELVWLENPGGNFRHTWTSHVLTHGPDVYFRFTRMATPDGMKECIFTAQFFTESISVYWTSDSSGLFTDTKQLQSRVIDASIGRVFEVDVADLNGDGRPDLLVTTNGNNGTLLAYEIPDDFRTGKFVKHTIAVGFSPRSKSIGKGAPGSAIAVHPQPAKNTSKPVILLSGDDDGRAYVFEAASQDPAAWAYNKQVFFDAGDATVGELSAADVDNDGYTDVFVPSFNGNEVIVYSFRPALSDQNILG
ncbi:uncharacterized protein LOC128231181 [Mya arenaria]|uniref:uncharacterized protein LOC128231181 n=1 Tax=Mya arenaria TaxID=6604 RepID=UPI0022DFE8D3|nr:uncharacterized protein LOC128231181 [Mya arenaria]